MTRLTTVALTLLLCSSAGLTPSLQDPNATYTVLVPTNAAFANLSRNVLNTSDINTLRLVGDPAIMQFSLKLKWFNKSLLTRGTCQHCRSVQVANFAGRLRRGAMTAAGAAVPHHSGAAAVFRCHQQHYPWPCAARGRLWCKVA